MKGRNIRKVRPTTGTTTKSSGKGMLKYLVEAAPGSRPPSSPMTSTPSVEIEK